MLPLFLSVLCLNLYRQDITHKIDLASLVCMNDHVLSFFIHKFTDGKEGGLCEETEEQCGL